MQELARQLAALKTLADWVNDGLKTVKTAMQQQMEATGASRVEATLPDGTKIGTISRPSPKKEARVIDEDAFLKWVREHTKGAEIVSRVVTEVRPAYRTALLAEMTSAGAPTVFVDRENGVIEDVPGVEIRPTRNTTHSVRLADGARAAVVAAWRAGTLGTEVLPELTAGADQ
jgi:uncharacterized protein (DUF2267 family)